MIRLGFLLTAGAALLLTVTAAAAQTTAPVDTACSYSACALRFEENRVVRGAAGELVAKPGFFSPIRLVPLVSGDSALAHAVRHDRAASRGAWLTNIGGLAMLAGVVVAHARDANCDRNMFGLCNDGDSWHIAATGLVLGGSVMTFAGIPFMRRAWREQARTVWWHNAQFAR